MRRLLLQYLLTTIFLCSTCYAIPSEPIDGSNLECAGGWGSNYVFLRLSEIERKALSFAEAQDLIYRADVAALNKIRNLKAKKKNATTRKRKKALTAKINEAKSFREYIAVLSVDVQQCEFGLLISNNPENGVFGFGTISPSSYNLIAGGLIYASDGQFLGVVSSNKFSSESIANDFGPYGNPFGSTSIFNAFSPYGGKFATKSPFNQFATAPPIIYVGATPAAYLTVNTFRSPRVDPVDLAFVIGREDDLP